MRRFILMLSFAASATLAACATTEAPPVDQPDEPSEAAVDQGVCTDTWECWCNSFSTRTTCNAAVSGGRHCYWAGPALGAAQAASNGQCHATYE